jgi:hypothetical protein
MLIINPVYRAVGGCWENVFFAIDELLLDIQGEFKATESHIYKTIIQHSCIGVVKFSTSHSIYIRY